MQKLSHLRGHTGSPWLDNAWFTMEIDGQLPSLTKINDLNAIKELLTRRIRATRTPVDFAALRMARQEIETGSSRYLWAFPRFWDALNLLRRHGTAWYHPYENPASVDEMYLSQLYARFPMTPESDVKLLIFGGAGICIHPHFGTDSPPLLAKFIDYPRPLSDWWRYGSFEYGLYLVRYQPDEPEYRIDEAFIRQIQDKAVPKKHHSRYRDRYDLEPLLETSLPPILQRLFGCKPDEKPAK